MLFKKTLPHSDGFQQKKVKQKSTHTLLYKYKNKYIERIHELTHSRRCHIFFFAIEAVSVLLQLYYTE